MNQFTNNIIIDLISFWNCIILNSFLDHVVFILKSDSEIAEINQQLNSVDLYSSLQRVVFNQVVVTSFVFFLMPDFPIGSLLTLANIYKLPLFIACLDFASFFVHLSWHVFAPDIHSQHHKWKFSMGFCAWDVHPLEHFSHIATIAFCALFVGLNYDTVCFIHVFAIVYDILIAHGGYFVSSHFLHHKSAHINYGIFGLTDFLFATNENVS